VTDLLSRHQPRRGNLARFLFVCFDVQQNNPLSKITEYHRATALAAQQDLRRSLSDEQLASIRGTPMRKQRRGRIYWYDTYRVDDAV
jgi:hypothetical protein